MTHSDPDKITRHGLYELGDRPRGAIGQRWLNMRARWTGEKRPPKAGEWYLSGAVINAYKAPNDLSNDYHIAELVHTKNVRIMTGRVDD